MLSIILLISLHIFNFVSKKKLEIQNTRFRPKISNPCPAIAGPETSTETNIYSPIWPVGSAMVLI